MKAPPPRKWRRRCKRLLRGLAITLLLIIFVTVAACTYLNEVGLPDFAKGYLLKELHSRGVDLQFTRMRYRFRQGIIAENVRFGMSEGGPDRPTMAAAEVVLDLNHDSLRHFKFEIDALNLKEGQVVWPLVATNPPVRRLSIDHIQTQLRFLTNDHWALDQFTASFAGANLHINGSLTNASKIRDWQIFHTRAQAQPGKVQSSLGGLEATLGRLHYSRPPELSLDLHGDGNDLQSFNGWLRVQAQDADTPWGSLTNGLLSVHLIPRTDTNARPHAEFSLRAASARTPWAVARNLQLEVHGVSDQQDTNVVHAALTLNADRIFTEWAQSPRLQLNVTWSHSFTNAIPLDGKAFIKLTDINTRWAKAKELNLDAQFFNASDLTTNGMNPAWGWWSNLAPYQVSWEARLLGLQGQDFQVRELISGGGWRAPELTLTNLHSELYGGELNLHAGLNIDTRKVRFDGTADFDAKKILPLLPSGAEEWMRQFSWEKPPVLAGSGGATLPPWTEKQPDWENAVTPTLQLKAEFGVGAAAYKSIPVQSAHGHLIYTNLNWDLPDLVADRPEGRLFLVHRADDRTHRFYFGIKSQIDLKVVRPLLPPEAQEELDSLILSAPPEVNAEIWGKWHEAESIGAKASVAVTNFVLRGESIGRLEAHLEYTNHFLLVLDPQADRGTQHISAASLGVDIDHQTIHLTNGFSTMEPSVLLHIIGPKITATMAPYQFSTPPTVHAYGDIPLLEHVPANLHFQVDGGPFHWSRFNVSHLRGGVHWVKDALNLSDIQADFYSGTLTGNAAFDFSPPVGSLFNFEFNATNVDFHSLVADAFESPTNHLEGRLSGQYNVTKADTDDWNSWFGNGHAELHNGFIWELPVFGVFSKVLDGLAPELKLGESRATEATANFIITNSIIYSDNLLIGARGLTMRYRGTVDFQGRTLATVEAKPLKNVPVVGSLANLVLSPVTKLFEYKVTGTLNDPHAEPQNVPKIFMDLLHPIGTIKRLLPKERSTNSPAPESTPPK